MENSRKIKLGLLLASLLVALIVVTSIFEVERIDAANEGIKVNLTGSNRGVDNVAVVSGWVFYNELTTAIYETPLSERPVDYNPFLVTSKDNSVFTIDPTISYNVVKGQSARIFTRYRKKLDELESTHIFQVVKDAARIQANSMTADSLMSNRGIFENAVQLKVTEEFTKMGLNLVNFTSGLVPPKSLTEAIEAKNVAVQNAIKYANEAKAEKAKAEIVVAEAEGSAKAEVARAKGRYDAAVYDAKATKEKAQSLTPLIVEMERIKKWNGDVPQMMGAGQTPIIDLRK
jgi:regulator of protease activity HflC (stomatin/prohibitin superfamily)